MKPICEAVRWHQQLAEEATQCRFYPDCMTPIKEATATLEADEYKFKMCMKCLARYQRENPGIPIKASGDTQNRP